MTARAAALAAIRYRPAHWSAGPTACRRRAASNFFRLRDRDRSSAAWVRHFARSPADPMAGTCPSVALRFQVGGVAGHRVGQRAAGGTRRCLRPALPPGGSGVGCEGYLSSSLAISSITTPSSLRVANGGQISVDETVPCPVSLPVAENSNFSVKLWVRPSLSL